MEKQKIIVVQSENYKLLSVDFFNYRLKLGYNLEGCKSGQSYLNEFLSWLEQNGIFSIGKVNAKTILDYYQYISRRPSKRNGEFLSQKTTHSHMRNIQNLFVELQRQSKIKTNPFSTLKFPYPRLAEERIILNREEIKELYKAAETKKERAILSLAYGCGLRASELVNCNVEDVRIKEKILIVTKGKGNKRRVVPISLAVAKDLQNYYKNERKLDSNQKSFILHSRGGRMQKYTYNKHLKKMLSKTNIQKEKQNKLSLHNLRHSIATHLLEQGISIEQVRMFLGHSQLETTEIYTHITSHQLEKLI